MMKLSICSVVPKTDRNSTTRIIIQSLLQTTLIFGVTAVPVHAQVAPEKMSSKISQPRATNVKLNSSIFQKEWGIIKSDNNVPLRAQVLPAKLQPKILQSERIIKIGLNRSGLKDEWAVVKIGTDDAGQTVNVYHTSQVRNDLLSTVVTLVGNFATESLVKEVIKGYTGPVFIPDINFHWWADHSTRNLTFIPDGCDAKILPQSTCVIRGTDTLMLPAGMKIQAGQLTMEYLEESLVRSVTLRVPSE
jgi:hypothetical protein